MLPRYALRSQAIYWLDEVNDGYSAGRDRPPIVLGQAGSWSSLNASKPVMRQLAG